MKTIGLSVLLVDDSDIFRTRMRRLLEEEPGVTVREARNGFDGLIAIEQARPDTVLLDLHMPDMDGFAVLGAIRERFGALAVIVLSANLTAAARRRCLELGVNALVDKADAALAIVPAIQRATGLTVPEGA